MLTLLLMAGADDAAIRETFGAWIAAPARSRRGSRHEERIHVVKLPTKLGMRRRPGIDVPDLLRPVAHVDADVGP